MDTSRSQRLLVWAGFFAISEACIATADIPHAEASAPSVISGKKKAQPANTMLRSLRMQEAIQNGDVSVDEANRFRPRQSSQGQATTGPCYPSAVPTRSDAAVPPAKASTICPVSPVLASAPVSASPGHTHQNNRYWRNERRRLGAASE